MSSTTTLTAASSLGLTQGRLEAWPDSSKSTEKERELPQSLPSGFMNAFEKLSHEQAGHIRHFHNLVSQVDGEWALMGSQEPGQEWLDAYRYQLATMAYAAGATHYHRLPALRSVFKALIERLIHKMLRREVWGYWYLTSQSGNRVDPDLKTLRKPWADPIVKENIMYSGHLILMVSLHAMLFNDDKYNKEGVLTFDWNPIFWGFGPEKFSYTRTTLQDAILAEMEREKWLGVCCEPNSIFVICNQFPLIAMRYNDVRNGTNIVEDVLEKYKTAWKEKGMIQEDGLFVDLYSPKQDSVKHTFNIGFTAWASAYMNAWNPSVAHSTFTTQSTGFLSRVAKDRVNMNSVPVAQEIRSLVKDENADPNSLSTVAKAREIVAKTITGGPQSPFSNPTFGYVIKWVSEVGDKATLDGLLNHADKFMNPSWQRGGLYYARNDEEADENGNWTMMEPFTGNSAIAYARLNVFDGQRKMWLNPWMAAQVSAAPFIDGVDLKSDVDFLRGCWNEELGAMGLTMRSWGGDQKRIRPRVCNLQPGRYGVYQNGELHEYKSIGGSNDFIGLELEVDGNELDVVRLKA